MSIVMPGSAASVKRTLRVLFVLSAFRTSPTSSTISAVNPSSFFSERMEVASLSLFEAPFAGLAGESMGPESQSRVIWAARNCGYHRAEWLEEDRVHRKMQPGFMKIALAEGLMLQECINTADLDKKSYDGVHGRSPQLLYQDIPYDSAQEAAI